MDVPGNDECSYMGIYLLESINRILCYTSKSTYELLLSDRICHLFSLQFWISIHLFEQSFHPISHSIELIFPILLSHFQVFLFLALITGCHAYELRDLQRKNYLLSNELVSYWISMLEHAISSYSEALSSWRWSGWKILGRMYCLMLMRKKNGRGNNTPAIGVHAIPKQNRKYTSWKTVNKPIIM